MVSVRAIALFVVAVASFTFVAFFGRLPALRNTPVGFLHRFIVIHVPSSLRRLDNYLTNGRITNGGSRLGHYLTYEKHPVVLIFFLGLVTASAILFVPAVWQYLPLRHKLLIPILLPQPFLFTYLSAKRNDTTYINQLNHAAHMRHYPYDRVLFYPGLMCGTCHMLKPPRSKHCSICKTCVSRMDHHCVWVNNCLGRGNYRWFLALLLSTAVLLAYAAYLAYITLTPLTNAHYTKYERWYEYEGDIDPTSWPSMFDVRLHYTLIFISIYLEVGGLSASGVGLLALLTWPLPLGLLGYHIYLIWAGMSTNESAKWADWRDDMADGVVFIGDRREETMHSYRISQPPAPYSESSSISGTPVMTPPETPPEEEEPRTTWPLESRHILIRTREGKPPESLPPRIRIVAKEDSFKRVWNLSEVENVYDLGFWDNFVEAMK